MKKKILATILAAAMLMSAMGTSVSAFEIGNSQPAAMSSVRNTNPLRLWYTSPAPVNTDKNQWQSTVLPLGNGYMGGMVFGGIAKERVHFNEKTMWTGGPSASRPNHIGSNRSEPVTTEWLDQFRAELDDKTNDVWGLSSSAGNNKLLDLIRGPKRDNWDNGMGMYQDFGDIYMDFARAGITDEMAENYVRDLDLTTALSTVSYDIGGVHYTREYFNSYPDNVLAMRLNASEAGKLTFDASITPASSTSSTNRTVTAEGDIITLRGQIRDNQLQYEAQLKVINEGGTITANDDGTISIDGADSVTLILACGTDYLNDWPKYRGEDPHEAISARIDNAADKGFDALYQTHLKDYQELFSRVDLDLGEELPNIPTNELIQNYRNGDYNKSLEVLTYQMGRYLTIAGSRENTLPTNLNGVWMIGSASQFWNADYHMNVNFQMNYWPTMAANLAECMLPYNDYMESLVEPGRVTAGATAGLSTEPGTPIGEGNGFNAHTVNNIFGTTGPYQVQEFGWTLGGASWALENSYDYYAYTQDEDYLRDKIYPMLKEQANFYSKFLWHSDYQNRLVVGPSVSPEQGPTTNGSTFDQSIAWEAFEEAINASEALGVDEDLRATWAEMQSQLNPIIVGDEGQIKEWYEETTIGKAQAGDLDEVNIPNYNAGYAGPHRHISHLVGLFPGTLINENTPEWLEAAKYSLEKKGFKATGWSKAHKLNTWARTKDAENTYKMVQAMLSSNYAGIMDNLFASHGQGTNHEGTPVFQIEANYGYTSGINEMLVQSQLGYVDMLPAIPEAWDEGSVEGIVARGNFELDMEWSNNSADRFVILSRAGGTFTGQYKDLASYTVKTADGTPVETTKLSDDKISFETVKGESYVIDFNTTPVKLENQIKVANELLAQMDTDLLSTAKQVLTDCIVASQEIVDNEQSDKYYEQTKLLSSACKTAQSAIELNTTLTDAQAFYNELDPNADWATLRRYTETLAEELSNATAALQNSEATSETYTAALTALTTAVDNIKGLDAQLTVTFTPNSGQVVSGDLVTMSCPFEDLQIRYTTDGNDPFSFSNIYTGPIAVKNGGMTVKAALYNGTVQMSDVFTAVYTTAVKENVAPTATEVVESDYYNNSAYYNGRKAVDGSTSTRWATNNGTQSATLELTFENPVTVDSAAINQYYYSSSNDIKNFNIEYWNGEEWIAALTGGSMGTARKEFSFDEFTANKIRLNIIDGSNPSIYEFELFKPVVFEETETNKTILSKVIDSAAAAIESGEVDNAIQSVRESFMATYNYAVAVNENPTSDQETIDRAWVSLMTEIHKLGLIAGDKTTLQEHYDFYSALDLELYIDGAEKDNFIAALDAALKVLNDGDAMEAEIQAADSALIAAADALVKRGDKEALQNAVDLTVNYDENDYAKGWDAFVAARDAANEVLGNKNATQEEVDSALDTLINAMLDLRYKADKSILNKLTKQAEAIDLTGFSKASVDAFNAALANAKAAAADPTLSTDEQDVVNKAVSDLSEAIKGLTYADGTPADIQVNGDGSITGNSASAKTGETTPIAMAVAALLLAGGAAVVLKKEKH
ncbi:MAG: glycoside hydrolase N-terminal domain-containing protein [Massilioclostridium sp.]|nr:glycoside hydrolase N-terminal domain-containing protein [Massilioclostridium sp.]